MPAADNQCQDMLWPAALISGLNQMGLCHRDTGFEARNRVNAVVLGAIVFFTRVGGQSDGHKDLRIIFKQKLEFAGITPTTV